MRALILGTFLIAITASAQTKAPADLSGVWTRGSGGRGGAITQWTSKPLPFTPEGKAKLDANKPGKGPRAVPPALGNDPVGGANPPGLYRTLVYNRAFELIQLNNRVLQIFEWGKYWRVIYTDGRPVPDDIPEGPFWYGHSVGKWEGDTLVVQTLALDERAWLDEWGTPMSIDAKVEERWRRTAKDKMELTIKVTDPEYYKEPWVSDPRIFTLDPKGELIEVIFAPIDEQVFNERVRDPAAGIVKK